MSIQTRRRYALVTGIAMIAVVAILALAQPALAHSGSNLPLQPNPGDPQVTVLPEGLERISWSAIIAGSIVAIILQLAINLLAVGIGVSTINPADTDGSTSVQDLGRGAIIAVVISMLVSLFAGGWLAARFSGMPERVDGFLHGVMVWGVVTLVTVFFLTTTIGRFISGITSLLGQGLRLAGMTAQTVVKGAANVAQGVAQTAGGAVQSVANAAQDAASNAQDQLEQSPEVADIMRKKDQVMAQIRSEANRIMQQTGVTPDRVKEQVQSAGQQVQDAAKSAVQNPADADRIFNETLTRILNQGQSATNQVDEQALVDLMVQRGNITEDQARQVINRWQNGVWNAQQQLNYVMQQAKDRAGQLRDQAEAKVEDIKEDAERVARETAQSTTEAISRLALAAFVAIAIGVFAAGIGGYAGSPQELPTASVSTSMR